MSWVERRRHALLAAIVAIALAAAATWALRVPLLAAPDENTHGDYVFAIWSHGAPIEAALHPLRIDVHPYTRYLEDAGGLARTRFDDGGQVPAGYGGAAFFAAADRAAPAVAPDWWRTSYGTPYIAASYPFGYYAIEALVFGAAMALTHSLVGSFFAMRFFDVALLGVTVLACYGILRELRVSVTLALLGTAAIGWLPTMHALYGSVQPDALAVTLFQISLLLVLRARRLGLGVARVCALGAVFAVFAVVKLHIFAAAAVASAPVLVFALGRERGASARAWKAAAIVLPAFATARYAASLERHLPNVMAYSNNASPVALLRAHPGAYLAEAGRVALFTLRDLYGGLPAEVNYYHSFSALHTAIFADPVLQIVDVAIVSLTAIACLAMLARFATTGRGLVRIARRRSVALALRLATGDVVLSAYVAFAAILVAAEIYVDEEVKPEGRYYLPMIAGAVAIAIAYAPRVLARRVRRRVATAMALLLALYGAAGTVAGIAAIDHRYYRGGNPESASQEYAIYLLRFAPAGLAKDVRTIERGDVVRVEGYAFDSHRTTPTTVVARLDDRTTLRVRNGLVSDLEVAEMGDEALLHGGFAFEIDTRALAPGPHRLTLFAREPGGLVPARRPPLVFTVTAP